MNTVAKQPVAASGRSWAVLVACCIICTIGFGGGMTCFSLFVAPLVSALEVPVASVTLFFTIATIVAIPAVVVAPRLLAKKAGVVVGACGIVSGLGFVALASMPSLPMLYGVAVAFGLTCIPATTLMAPIVINNWFVRNQGTFVGVALACTGIGGALLSPLFTQVIGSAGWQAAMTAQGVLIAVVVGVLGFALIRFAPANKKVGASSAAEGDEGANASARDSASEGESQEAKPGLTFKEFFRTPAVVLLCASLLLVGVVASINQQANVITQLSGFTAVAAGLVVSCQSVGNIFGKLMLGAVRDRKGGPVAGLVGAVFMVAGFALMLAGIVSGTEVLMYVGGFVCGLGSCLGTMAAPLFTMDAAGPREYGTIYGVLSVFASVGVALGAPIVSGFFDATGSYQMALVTLIVLAVLLVPLAFAGIRGLRKKWA